MSIEENQFKIKLKKCKSLQDYRDLEEEYNMQQHKTSTDYIRKIIRNSKINPTRSSNDRVK